MKRNSHVPFPERRRVVFAAGVALAIFAGVRPATGQVLPPASHDAESRLASARRAIRESRFVDAVQQLDLLLSREREDGFVAADGEGIPKRTVRRESVRLLAAMPPEGLAYCETWCGPEAGKALGEAIQSRDLDAVAAVARRYAATTAGGQAALALGYDALDRGRPWDALAWLRHAAEVPTVKRSLEPELALATATAWIAAGRPDRAREALGRLAPLGPAVAFRVGDEHFTCADDPARVVAALRAAIGTEPAVEQQAPANWPLFRGDPAKNAECAWDGRIGPMRWRIETADASSLHNPFQRGGNTSNQDGAGRLPAAHPLIVDRLVLVRTHDRLVAVDAESGRQVWEYPWGGDGDEFDQQAGRDLTTWQRAYDDSPYGQIASDGRRVFLLAGLGAATGRSMPVAVMVAGRGRVAVPKAPHPFNRLVALDIAREGSLAWSVGSASGEDEPRLAGAFFVGPPLPHDGGLYALAEIEGEITLVTLDAATGRLEWSLPLAVPSSAIFQDPQRRLAGATPSMAEGVLVCPTSAGAVVAVDPVTRSVRWGYEYPVRAQRGVAWKLRMARLPIAAGGAAGPAGSADSSVTIAGGRAVFAPVESERLLCVGLRTGDLAWEWEAGDLLYVAGVWEDTVAVVGARGLSAWSLTTGKPAWDELVAELPDGTLPAGRGLRVGRFYYLPTTAGQIVRFDLADGRIVARTPVESEPGNLVATYRLLVWQTATAVKAFDVPPP